MDANLLTFSGSAAVALFASFLSWGRGLKSCVVAVVATVALVGGVFSFRLWQFGWHAGPPDWNRRCEEHLKRQGIAPELRHRVIGREGLSRMEVVHLLKTGDAATYCLLSSNDSLSDTDLEYMYEHGDGEVRYILARNLRREDLRRAFERRYETAYARERALHMWALMGHVGAHGSWTRPVGVEIVPPPREWLRSAASLGARRTRAAPGAGRPQAGGSQFIATGAGGHPAGQHGARGDTNARRRLRVGLHAHQSRVA